MLADAWDVKRRIGDDGAIRGIMRPAHPDLKVRARSRRPSPALHKAGIDDIAFYNYGLFARGASTGSARRWRGR